MSNVIQNINRYGLPTNSYIRAVQSLKDEFDGGDARMLNEILGSNVEPLEAPYTRIQVAYVVQEAVRMHMAGEQVDPVAVYDLATSRAREYVQEHPWVFVEREAEQTVDANGEVSRRRRKGEKQARAANLYVSNKDKLTQNEMIELFMEELEMSKAGARTYVYNNKKQHGACKSDQTSKRGKTKGERAQELYKQNPELSKDELIELFVTELETSKAGAATQYYACRKKLG